MRLLATLIVFLRHPSYFRLFWRAGRIEKQGAERLKMILEEREAERVDRLKNPDRYRGRD